MSDVDDVYQPLTVGYSVDHTIVTDANSEKVVRSFQLGGPSGPWDFCESINDVSGAASNEFGKAVVLARGGRCDQNPVVRHASARPHLFVRERQPTEVVAPLSGNAQSRGRRNPPTPVDVA